MATTDNSIQYDLKVFDAHFKYAFPNATRGQKAFMREVAETGSIQAETLIEQAISVVGNLPRDSTVGRDFVDGSDAKKVVSNETYKYNRSTGYSYWRYDYKVVGIANKTGVLRIVGYNKIRDTFDYFKVPYTAYAGKTLVEISLDSSGYVTSSVYRRYKVATFQELAA